MAVQTGSAALTTSASIPFRDTNGVSALYVRGSDGTCRVNIPGLHVEGEFFILPSDEIVIFRLLHNGIRKMIAKSSSGTPTLTFGALEKKCSEQ